MNRLKGRFAAQQILGGRAYQQDDYSLIERGTHPGRGRSQTLLPGQYDGVALQARSRFWGGNDFRRDSRIRTKNRLIKTLLWV